MLALYLRHPAKFVWVAVTIPLSFVLTLLAVLDLPLVRANPTTPQNGVNVDISGSAFNPAAITVTAGTVVTWTNFDAFEHTATGDPGSLDPWDSGTLAPNGIFTRTFNLLGTYTYHCAIHPGMRGTVAIVTRVYLPLILR
jgi:plastocyanin